MCEPSHSILQFPTEIPNSDVDYLPRIQSAVGQSFNLQVESAQPKQRKIIKDSIISIPQGTVIGSFINYSRLGSGHSECLSKLRHTIRGYLPDDMKYEAQWWDRKVKPDCYINPVWLREILIEESLLSAISYAKRSSIGDLKILRRFLESSLRATENHERYTCMFFYDLLSEKGREGLMGSLKRFFDGKAIRPISINVLIKDEVFSERVIGIMMKMTRKREFLNDAWADDVVLWNKDNKKERCIM